MTISPRFMDELRDRLTLSDIVGKRVKLTRSSAREFKACCPFHHEKSPSFTLNDEKQFYHCFGCGAHGDAINFVMQHDNISFIDALELLAAEAGMQVPKQSPQEVEKAQKQKDLYALLEDTTKWFEAQLRDGKNREALAYMHERGVDDDLMAQFRVGYAPGDGQALWQHLKQAGYTEQQMVDAGVVRRSTRGTNPYAFFRERIMFPVSDRRGRVVAFGGRILPDHLRPPDRGDHKPPKYINSSDSQLFHKGRMLYGESHARQAAAEGQPLLVVEGYLDVMSCFSAGFRGAVAPLGTALTEEQIAILWKMFVGNERMPVLCFDGDNAGRRAAARACGRILPLLEPNQSARFAFLPEGQDPDSLIKAEGTESFQRVLDNAMPLSEFLWAHHTAGKSFDTPESKAGLEKLLEEETLRIADRTVQQYYRQAFRNKMYEAFRSQRQFKPNKPGGKGTQGRPLPVAVQVRKPVFSPDILPYQILLATLINHPVLFEEVEEMLGHLAIPNERLDLLRQTILNILASEPALDSDGLQSHLKGHGFVSELKAVLSEAVYTHAGFARPGAPEDTIFSGWQETCAFMQKKAVWRELKAAGKALAQDFSPDNEEKMMALHDVNKASEDKTGL